MVRFWRYLDLLGPHKAKKLVKDGPSLAKLTGSAQALDLIARY